MAKSLKSKEFQLGACYYPEHWPETLWSDDYKRMREMDFSIVRMAEFAWSIFEPAEGEFSFELFDRAIDLAHQYGIKVILCTPTATPPAWLTHKYPEVLNVSQEGVQYQHGQRRHYNYNAPVYQELCARIVREMANHYKDHPTVVGWQIDNELNCEINVFYSEADHASFRKWLKEKYGKLDNLNKAWGAVFWNQTYTDWDQIYLTRPTVSDSPNPHQALDEKRFISDSAIHFAELQQRIIKEIAPHQWISTNGVFGHLDSHKMTDHLLDFIAFDSYPNFSTVIKDSTTNPLLDRKWSWNLSIVRSISPNFAVFEQQSGGGGWVNRIEQPSPKPGQMRLWTYQSIAHGADMILYFRWRTATMGTEIYWHGINDYHNRPNRRVAEATKIGKELNKFGNKLLGSKYQANVAIVKNYDNEWDGELDIWHGPFENASINAWYKAFQYNHIPADALFLREETTVEELLNYKLLVYPHPTIMTEVQASLLKEYIQKGGKIVFGCRAGYKNADGQCYMDPFPGPISDLCGVTVEDFTMIGPSQSAVGIKWEKEAGIDSTTIDYFNEILQPISENAKIMARFTGSYYQESPAIVKNSYGEGFAYYLGGVFNEKIATELIQDAGCESPVNGLFQIPRAVEVSIRENTSTKEKFVFLLNYSEEVQSVRVEKEALELITDTKVNGSFTIEPHGVAILSI